MNITWRILLRGVWFRLIVNVSASHQRLQTHTQPHTCTSELLDENKYKKPIVLTTVCEENQLRLILHCSLYSSWNFQAIVQHSKFWDTHTLGFNPGSITYIDTDHRERELVNKEDKAPIPSGWCADYIRCFTHNILHCEALYQDLAFVIEVLRQLCAKHAELSTLRTYKGRENSLIC